VHEALDSIGGIIGPLVVAGMLAVTAGTTPPHWGVLAIPGVAVLALLIRLRIRVPDPSAYERPVTAPQVSSGGDLDRPVIRW
jgi:hypothetical protein